jgi:hypothetical protein
VTTTYTFSGSSNGGTASATIVATTDGNTLTATIRNTTSNATGSFNDATITGFGFDLAPAGLNFQDVTSWSLTALSTPTSPTPVLIGGAAGGIQLPGVMSPAWILEGTDDGITLDFVANTLNGNNGGLLNPANFSAAFANRWFTDAVFTAVFNAPVSLAPSMSNPDGICNGQEDTSGQCAQYVRMQEVGDGGSLKLVGTTVPDGRVPLPGTLALLGLGLVAVGAMRAAAPRRA